ncbi:MAG: Asp23/Gls24 family envelope stress response protein [Firmicutes bacterium]|nr:Asp23/Gls24 family envelope stress response protein [Bacillota bacterium]
MPGEETRTGDPGRAVVKIADEVVSTVAAIAATEVDGVVAMSGGLVGGLSEMLGRRNPQKGVRVEVDEGEASIDLTLTVRYGVRIPEVAARVQENVKAAVEGMTGLRVRAVNVHVTGVEVVAGEGGAKG